MEINDDKILETLIEIKTTISEISANQRNFQTIITNHENRILSLENFERTPKTPNDDKDLKNYLLKLGAKCLLVGLTAILTLVGGSGIFTKLFGE